MEDELAEGGGAGLGDRDAMRLELAQQGTGGRISESARAPDGHPRALARGSSCDRVVSAADAIRRRIEGQSKIFAMGLLIQQGRPLLSPGQHTEALQRDGA